MQRLTPRSCGARSSAAGVAALETRAGARRARARADRRDACSRPTREFVYRPMTVREPFAYAPPGATRSRGSSRDAGAELLARRARLGRARRSRLCTPRSGARARVRRARAGARRARHPALQARDHDRRPPHGRDAARADPGRRGRLRRQPRVRRARADGVAAAAVRARADDRRTRLRHERRARDHDRHPRGQPAGDLRLGGERRASRELLERARHRDDQLRLRRGARAPARS